MARKHNLKRNRVKQPVTRTVVQKATTTTERVVTEVPAGTEGAIAVKQEDGTEKFFVVSFKGTPEVVAQGRALGSTIKGRGLPNKPENMAPKGSKMSKSAPTSKK